MIVLSVRNHAYWCLSSWIRFEIVIKRGSCWLQKDEVEGWVDKCWMSKQVRDGFSVRETASVKE